MRRAAGELKVSDIARRHHISRMTAYRWMVEIEKKHGPAVVGRRGKRGVLITTEDAWMAVAPLVRGLLTEIEERIEKIEEHQAESDVLGAKTAERVGVLEKDFRQLSLRWFDRSEKVRRTA